MGELCDEALANLYPYLDAEMDDSEIERIRMHLIDCPPCGDAFGFEQRLKLVVRERLAEEVPESALLRFRQALRGIEGPPL